MELDFGLKDIIDNRISKKQIDEQKAKLTFSIENILQNLSLKAYAKFYVNFLVKSN